MIRTRTVAITVGLCALTPVIIGVADAAPAGQGYIGCSTDANVLRLTNAQGGCAAGQTKVTLGARGPKGPRGPAGLDTGYYDFADTTFFPASSNFQTLATVPNLPAGTYSITAKLYLVSDQDSYSSTDCELVAGQDSDLTATSVYSRPDFIGVPLEVAHTYASAGSATVQCDNYGADVYVRHVKIMAIPLSGMVTTTG